MSGYYLLICYLFIGSVSMNGQVFDFEGNKYDTVQIGNQVWLKQNMRSTRYPDGMKLDPNNYKCPNGNCNLADSFGLLYNYWGLSRGETGKTIRGICPHGYAIPTPQNWHELMLFLNADTTWLWKTAYNYVSYKIIDKRYGGTGETDLSIVPAGLYIRDNFYNFGTSAEFRLIDSTHIKSLSIYFDGGTTGTVNVSDFVPELKKSYALYLSCRCIKAEIDTSNKIPELNFKWRIYPNPCSDYFSIISGKMQDIKSVELINIYGQEFELKQDMDGKYNLNRIPQGIYYLKISDQVSTEYIELLKIH